jgi:hypothetical protein
LITLDESDFWHIRPDPRRFEHELFDIFMAIQPFDEAVGMDAEQFALPLLDQVWRAHN